MCLLCKIYKYIHVRLAMCEIARKLLKIENLFEQQSLCHIKFEYYDATSGINEAESYLHVWS